MGKKKFIDKKKSATFTLVFRDTSAEDDAAAAPIRQFTRVDGGASFVPGFSEDDPRLRPGGGEYSDEEDYVEEDEADESVIDGEELDSRFGDADESDDGDEERVAQAKPKVSKGTVVKRAALHRQGGLSENGRRELIELGFPDDGYDYNQHMRSIASTGPGTAFVRSTRAADPLHADIRAYDASKAGVQPVSAIEEAEATEVIELVSSSSRPVRKPLSKDGVLDAEIIAALENSEGSQFDSGDELEDEFVIVASVAEEGQAPRSTDNATASSGHRQEGANLKQKPDEESDYEELFDDDEEDNELGKLPELSHRERPTRLLDEQFETLALNEYDDFDDGELEDDDPFARGHADISQFSSIMSEFLDDKDIYSEKYETIAEFHRIPGAVGSSDDTLGGGKTANTNMVANVGVENIVVQKTLELADRHSEHEELAVVEVESDEEQDDWDCETVVSTYSNLDNHPAKIGAPGKSKLRPKLQDVEKAGIIRLAGKQHLPVDYLPRKGDDDNQGGKPVSKEAVSSRKVAGPRAGETPEEKKARKALIKENKREARLGKKVLKLCYRNESQKAQHGAATMGPNVVHLP